MSNENLNRTALSYSYLSSSFLSIARADDSIPVDLTVGAVICDSGSGGRFDLLAIADNSQFHSASLVVHRDGKVVESNSVGTECAHATVADLSSDDTGLLD